MNLNRIITRTGEALKQTFENNMRLEEIISALNSKGLVSIPVQNEVDVNEKDNGTLEILNNTTSLLNYQTNKTASLIARLDLILHSYEENEQAVLAPPKSSNMY